VCCGCRTPCAACARSSLPYNQVRGTLPEALGALTTLKHLCAHTHTHSRTPTHAFTHPLLTPRLPFLRTRRQLNFGQMSGSLPAAMGAMSSLTSMCVGAGGERLDA
jgi:hypothetical protein